MKRSVGALAALMTLACALGTCRPASATVDLFPPAVNAAEALITLKHDCFRCFGAETLLGLLEAAEAAHESGNRTLCMAILTQAIRCVDQPSREFVAGVPVSVYFSQLLHYPVTVYRMFEYMDETGPDKDVFVFCSLVRLAVRTALQIALSKC
jgi:hypothetical protein